MRSVALIFLTIILFLLNLFIGSVEISHDTVISVLTGSGGTEVERFIILKSRLPMAITALLGGAGLSAAGLMLQTSFRNPLAGPSVLGINSGASLGVALVILLMGGSISTDVYSLSGYSAVVAGAFIGSLLILGILILLSGILKNTLMLLITGIMIGYMASSLIMLLNFSSTAEGVQSYVMWGMSSFSGVSMNHLPMFASLTVIGLLMSILLVKPLDILLLGDGYARNLGINLTYVRNLMFVTVGLLSATVTAFCGPVSFIGLSVPHITKLIFRTDLHRTLLPNTLLTGAGTALLCNLICVWPENSVIPLNAVTPLVGAPVVVWILLRKK